MKTRNENFLSRPLGSKRILWFEGTNRYLVVTPTAFLIIERLTAGEELTKVSAWCSSQYGLPQEEASRFVSEIQEVLDQAQSNNPESIARQKITGENIFELENHQALPSNTFYYSINGITFRVDIETEKIAFMMHPQFAHLEITAVEKPDHHLSIIKHLENLVLLGNGKVIGEWAPEEFNFMLGRYYMGILGKLHGKSDDDWMAVLHASAVSDGSNGLVFLGDSGQGKSTLSALMLSKGLILYADDFTPIDSHSGHIWYFPAALSVKKAAMEQLLPLFPQLENAKEFIYTATNKRVRYLAPEKQLDTLISSVPVKALIFVNYKKDSGLDFAKMSKDLAFKQLIPGSWISPIRETASTFLDWFINIPCYRLTYSDNEAMLNRIGELLKH